VPSAPASIRDRVEQLVAGATSVRSSEDRFVPSLNEGAASFQAWAEAYPASCLRRFQARTDATLVPPEMSTLDGDDRYCGITVLVAYPHTQRYANGLGRDDVIDADFGTLNEAIGVGAASSFAAIACVPFGCTKAITRGVAVDFLVITELFRYTRSL
jgi:hypothetical protein